MNKDQTAIDNFLGSLDMNMPMIDHFRNCMRDALIYKWNSAVVILIMAGIENAYRKHKKGE